MFTLDEIRGAAAIARIAESKGVTIEEVETSIQAAIDEAWSSVDPAARAVQRRVFRNKKPAPALFVGRMARYAKQK